MPPLVANRVIRALELRIAELEVEVARLELALATRTAERDQALEQRDVLELVRKQEQEAYAAYEQELMHRQLQVQDQLYGLRAVIRQGPLLNLVVQEQGNLEVEMEVDGEPEEESEEESEGKSEEKTMRPNKKKCSFCNRGFHKESQCWKKLRRCFRCGNDKHMAPNCTKPSNRPNKAQKPSIANTQRGQRGN